MPIRRDVFGFSKHDRSNEVSTEAERGRNAGINVLQETLAKILFPLQVTECALRHSP